MPNIPTDVLLMLHITAICFFLGGQFYYLFITQLASYAFFSTFDQIRYLQNVLKRQNPVLLLALCTAVVFGGFMITGLKGSYGTNYFQGFGIKLLYKLGLFMLVFFITAYQALSIGFKIRFMDPASDEKNFSEKLANVRLTMSITSVLNIILTVYIIYYSRTL